MAANGLMAGAAAILLAVGMAVFFNALQEGDKAIAQQRKQLFLSDGQQARCLLNAMIGERIPLGDGLAACERALGNYNVLQRDMQVDGGVRPAREDQVLAVRRRAAQAIQAVFAELGLPAITDQEVEAAVIAHSSSDMPDRNVVADLEAAENFLRQGRNGLDVIRALARHGFQDVAGKILEIQKLRVSGDYLQTSAIVLAGSSLSSSLKDSGSPMSPANRTAGGLRVLSAINDPNDYQGPGTGYHLGPARWQEIADIPQATDPRKIGAVVPGKGQGLFQETGEAKTSEDAQEIVIAVGPAFGSRLDSTLLGLPHREVLQALMEGVQEEGMKARVVKIYSTSDCGFIGHAGAQLSGSGISIGIQSKGTTVIHRRDLQPLNNLELFPQAPNLTLKSYQVIGRNAAKYAKGEPVLPVPVQIDNMARLKHIVKTTILHLRETELVIKEKGPQEVVLGRNI